MRKPLLPIGVIALLRCSFAAKQEQGFCRSHASSMPNRTASDPGYPQPVFTRAGALECCSASLPRELIRHDPEGRVLRPFTRSVCQLAAAGEIHVA